MSDGRRVLRVITRLNVGGPARHVSLLTRRLGEPYRTTLLVGTPSPQEGELVEEGLSFERVPLVRDVDPVNDVRAVAAIAAKVRAIRPLIVHTHTAKAGVAGRLAARSVRRRPLTVHTFHGHVLEGYFDGVAARAVVRTEQALARRTDRLVAVSAEVRDDLLRLGVGRPEQWVVIPLGLELDRHRDVDGRSGALRGPLGLDDDVPLVGAVGRLVAIKDNENLLRAVARLDGVHLAVVGDGELRPMLEARVEELGIRGRVHFVGWQFDMPAVMADLDVVALTSLNEGTPVALIEAAACGRPVVATTVGGVPSVVSHGVDGLLVPPSDSAAVADALAALLGDRALAAELGDAGRRRSSRFDAQRLLQDVRSLYAEMLG